MKSLDLTSGDKALAEFHVDMLCAVRFDESKKSNYQRILKLCSKADIFRTQEMPKRAMHLAGFKRTHKGAELAYQVLEEFRIQSWKYSLLANGKLQQKKNNLLNVLDCYMTASKLKRPQAHCHYIDEEAFEPSGTRSLRNFREDDPPKEALLIPCAYVAPFLNLGNRAVDPDDALEAVGNERAACLCPLWKPADMQLVPNITRTKQKKFWD